jgi:hypothetical protein
MHARSPDPLCVGFGQHPAVYTINGSGINKGEQMKNYIPEATFLTVAFLTLTWTGVISW